MRGPRPERAPGGGAQRVAEARHFGLNACLAVFAQRPQSVRKVWLAEERIAALREVLAWCVARRIGYRVVDADELAKVSGSAHHEGVCMAVLRRAPLTLPAWIETTRAHAPALALWLDGVGNPHNIGAITRSAAHFGVVGMLGRGPDPLDGGAAARVAEGGAEIVPWIDAGALATAFPALRAADWQPVLACVDAGEPVFASALPRRCLLVLGAEGEGIGGDWQARPVPRVRIPGTGAVQSLNVASAAALLLGEWWRQRHAAGAHSSGCG